jgi:hypothetical protein
LYTKDNKDKIGLVERDKERRNDFDDNILAPVDDPQIKATLHTLLPHKSDNDWMNITNPYNQNQQQHTHHSHTNSNAISGNQLSTNGTLPSSPSKREVLKHDVVNANARHVSTNAEVAVSQHQLTDSNLVRMW